jgi:hypothetical protein
MYEEFKKDYSFGLLMGQHSSKTSEMFLATLWRMSKAIWQASDKFLRGYWQRCANSMLVRGLLVPSFSVGY